MNPASHLNDCAKGYSNEHYISESVLGLFGKSVRISGFPWQTDDKSMEIGIESLSSKILCGHHNSQLSTLDEVGKAYYLALKKSFDNATGNDEFLSETIPIDGQKLELWLLKVLCGVLIIKRSVVIPELWVDILFQKCQFPENSGLYFFCKPGFARWYFNLLQVIFVWNKKGNIAGAKFGVGGLANLLAFGKPIFGETDYEAYHRPSKLIIQKGEAIKEINFTWGKYQGSGSFCLNIGNKSEIEGTNPITIVKPG